MVVAGRPAGAAGSRMRGARWGRATRCAVVAAGVAAVTGGALGPAAASPPLRTDEVLDVVQLEYMCEGELVPVSLTGRLRTTELSPAGAGEGLRVQAAVELRWEQDGVDYTASAQVSFLLAPGGRTSTYRFIGSGSGDDGSRVRLHEVVHAVWSDDGVPRLLVETDLVECG